MRRLGATLAVLIVAGAVIAVAAGATTVRDRDDVTTALDIAKAAGAHNRASDQLVHTIDFFDPLPSSISKSGGPPGSVCIEIWTRSTPSQSPADYEACATLVKGKWKGSLARKRAKGPQLRVGAVEVEQPTDTRLVLRIDPDDIKRPATYRWRAEAWDFGQDCSSSSGCPDYAPDRPDTAETKLSKPRN